MLCILCENRKIQHKKENKEFSIRKNPFHKKNKTLLHFKIIIISRKEEIK